MAIGVSNRLKGRRVGRGGSWWQCCDADAAAVTHHETIGEAILCRDIDEAGMRGDMLDEIC